MIKVITSFDKDDILENEWNRLFQVCPYVTPFQTFDFVSTASKYISSEKETLYIIVVVDDRTKEYKAILPTSIDRRGIVRFLCQDYMDFCSALVNPIYDNYSLYEEIVEYLKQTKGIRGVEFTNLKHDNPLLSTLKPFAPNFHVKECAFYSMLPLSQENEDKDFVDGLRSLNAKKKKNLRRYYDSFKENYVLKLLCKERGNLYPSDAIREMTLLMINKGIRSKEYFSSNMLRLWEELYEKCVLDIAVLIKDKDVVSINFIYNDKKHSEIIKWIMLYEDNSFNKAINLMIAEELYRQGGYTINFARGIYDYKLVNFHPDVKTLFKVTINKNYLCVLTNYLETTKQLVKDCFSIGGGKVCAVDSDDCNLSEHKFICLVEDHYNPLGLVRSLGEKGILPIVLLCNPKPHLVNKSKYIGELHTFASVDEGFKYLIQHYSKNEYKPFVYSCSDNVALLLDKNYSLLKDKFYFFNGCGLLKDLLQKHNLNELAKECGFRIPKEEVLHNGNFPISLTYPVFTKAVTSSNGDDWKFQSHVCYSEDDLKNVYEDIRADTVLVQDYIEKENEISLEGYSIDGGEQVYIPYEGKYYRMSDSSFGHYLFFYPFKNNDLLDKCKKLLSKAHYSGVFSVDLLVGKDKEIYFLEINFRNSAWSYASSRGNCNLPYLWALSTISKTIDKNCRLKSNINVMAEIDDLRGSVIQMKQTSLKQWIRDVRNTDVFMVLNKNDMAPFWSEMFFQIKHQFKKRILKAE